MHVVVRLPYLPRTILEARAVLFRLEVHVVDTVVTKQTPICLHLQLIVVVLGILLAAPLFGSLWLVTTIYLLSQFLLGLTARVPHLPVS